MRLWGCLECHGPYVETFSLPLLKATRSANPFMALASLLIYLPLSLPGDEGDLTNRWLNGYLTHFSWNTHVPLKRLLPSSPCLHPLARLLHSDEEHLSTYLARRLFISLSQGLTNVQFSSPTRAQQPRPASRLNFRPIGL